MRQTESSPLQHPCAVVLASVSTALGQNTQEVKPKPGSRHPILSVTWISPKRKAINTSPGEISQLSLFSFLPHNNPPWWFVWAQPGLEGSQGRRRLGGKMGVFDDDKIRCSPADCLLLPHTHLLEVAKMHTHSYVAARTWPPPSSLLRNYLLFRVLSYKSNWSFWPPADPGGGSGNLSPLVYTEDTAQASAQHSPLHPPRTSTHTSSWFVVSGGLLCWGFGAAWWSEICSTMCTVVPAYVVCAERKQNGWSQVLIASRKYSL